VVLLWASAVNRATAREADGSGRRKATRMCEWNEDLKQDCLTLGDSATSAAATYAPSLESEELDDTLIALVRVMARDAARAQFAARQQGKAGGSR
jgi:hypothetical protein